MKKSQDDLNKKLKSVIEYIRSQLGTALELECNDPLRVEYAVSIAARLRVLINDEGSNKSLLSLIGIKDALLFQIQKRNSKIPPIPSNIVFDCIMADLVMKGGEFYCKAKDWNPAEDVLYTFDAWWNEVVIDTKHKEKQLVSRRDIVLVLADKEGGAHVDEKYDESYYQTLFQNGYHYIDPTGAWHTIANNFYVESLLLIAQEFINAYLIKINLKPETYLRTNGQYKMLMLTYFQEKHLKSGRIQYDRKYRFYRYKDNTINEVIKLYFDYNTLASYRLLPLYQISNLYTNGKLHFAMVVDTREQSFQVAMMRFNSCQRPDVVIGVKQDGYYLFDDDCRLTNEGRGKTIESIKREISPSDPSLLDEFISKQIIKEPSM